MVKYFLKYSILTLLLIKNSKASFCANPSDSLIQPQKTINKKNNLLILAAGYRLPIKSSKINNSGHGIYIEGGVNLASIISKKHVFGIYVGLGFMDKLWKTSFNKDFANDYATSIKTEDAHFFNDSSAIKSSIELIKNKSGSSSILPGCQTNSFHNYTLYYGIVIKLPYKYFPSLKLYRGSMRSYFKGDRDRSYKGSDYTIYELRRTMYGCELVLFNVNQIIKKNTKKPYKLKNAGLSVYYENYNFYNSTLYFNNGVIQQSNLLKNFVSNEFLLKYKREYNLGFKIHFYIL